MLCSFLMAEMSKSNVTFLVHSVVCIALPRPISKSQSHKQRLRCKVSKVVFKQMVNKQREIQGVTKCGCAYHCKLMFMATLLSKDQLKFSELNSDFSNLIFVPCHKLLKMYSPCVFFKDGLKLKNFEVLKLKSKL